MGTASISYPIHDAHGNRICGLSRSGTTYATDALRYYGAWAEFREGATTGGSTSRHCADLGHVQDDDSGFVYMRARYYEPLNGRFASEDLDRQGHNWMIFCGNDLFNNFDQDGKDYTGYTQLLAALLAVVAGAALSRIGWAVAVMDLMFMTDWWVDGRSADKDQQKANNPFWIVTTLLAGCTASLADLALTPTSTSPASLVVGLMLEHTGFLMAFIQLMDLDQAGSG